MRLFTTALFALGLAPMVLTGCFDKEQPTCEYWVPKLTTAARGEKALAQVQELKCADALPTLGKMFDDGQFRVRILRAVKQIGDQDAGAPILKKALTQRDTGKLAAGIVADWKLKAARPELEAILTGTGFPKLRLEALKALLAIEDPKALESLLITLAGNDPNIQGMAVNKMAVEALGPLKSEAAIPTLLKAAFIRTTRGESIYSPARKTLSLAGPKVGAAVIAVANGTDKSIAEYADKAGLSLWDWRTGPQLVQLLGDTLDPAVGPILANEMVGELLPPVGVSPTATEKWRIAQLNRLKVAMLALGQVGAGTSVPTLAATVKNVQLDAINQRLNAATALALIGTPEAVTALLEAYKTETDRNFLPPLLQPLALALDFASLPAFQEATKEASPAVAARLKEPKIAAYLRVLGECKTDPGCYVGKLNSENQDETVKALVMLMRLPADASVRDALMSRFSSTTGADTDVRRFTVMALTRTAGEGTGAQLVKMGEALPASESFWRAELQIVGRALTRSGR